ncbi:hypothetical protein [Chitinibacter sp. S2-10]
MNQPRPVLQTLTSRIHYTVCRPLCKACYFSLLPQSSR